MEKHERELLERATAILERLEAEQEAKRKYERERKRRYRARLRGAEKQGGFFDDRPGVESLRLVPEAGDEPTPVQDVPGTPACPGDLSRGQNVSRGQASATAEPARVQRVPGTTVPGTCPGDSDLSRGQAPSEPPSRGTDDAQIRSDLIDRSDRSICKNPDLSIRCQDGGVYVPDVEELKDRFPALDVERVLSNLCERLRARPDHAPYALRSASSWLEVTLRNAERDSGIASPATDPPAPVRRLHDASRALCERITEAEQHKVPCPPELSFRKRSNSGGRS